MLSVCNNCSRGLQNLKAYFCAKTHLKFLVQLLLGIENMKHFY